MLDTELERPRLRPKTLEPPRTRNKGTMPAEFRRQDSNVWIPSDLRSLKSFERHDRVVLGRNDERRHGDPLRHAPCACQFVIIASIAIPAARSGDRVVEFAYRPH